MQTDKDQVLALTVQLSVITLERDQLKRKLEQYEKHGVTCQTYRHHLNIVGCGECNTGK